MTKTNKAKLLSEIRSELFSEFGDEPDSDYFIDGISLTRGKIKEDVKLASDDTGKNAPGSLVVIYTENGIPNPYRDNMAGSWYEMQARVNEKCPDTHWEAINGGCVAWYED